LELELTVDQQLFRETTRRFLEDSVPLTEVRRLHDAIDGFERDWWRRGAELGWAALLVSEAQGGGSVSEFGLRDLALVAEEQGRLVSPGPLGPVNIVAEALAAAPDPERFADTVAGLVAGDLIATWAFQEAGPGFGPQGITTTATIERDEVVLSGAKAPVEAAAQADVLLVTATGADGLVQVLVPVATPGVAVTPRQSVDIVKRYGAVTFDGARLPASAVLQRGEAAAAAMEAQLQTAVVLNVAETVGAIERVFEITLEWCFDRYSFGRPLSSYQEIKHRMADQRLWLEASRAVAAAATVAVATGGDDAGQLVSAAKSYIDAHAGELVQDCVQLHGGIGVTWEHDIHLYLRRVTLNSGVLGTVRDHRHRLAAVVGLA
jgi:alkylation response protein AidB-like acyl-CoA dehydrogenase